MKKQNLLFALLILFLLAINYPLLDKALINYLDNSQEVIVERIIDGDTFEFNKTSVRLLGINTPEKGEPLCEEAKKYLELLILDKKVRLEFGNKKYDKYSRLLTYAYLGEQNINLRMVEEGFANPYFPEGKTELYEDFQQAWKDCLGKHQNLCEKSVSLCSSCIFLDSFDTKTKKITLKNICSINCNLNGWVISGTGRRKLILNQSVSDFIDVSLENLYLISLGDTIYLRDKENKLVSSKSV